MFVNKIIIVSINTSQFTVILKFDPREHIVLIFFISAVESKFLRR